MLPDNLVTPAYRKVVDPDGATIALLFIKSPTAIVILSPVNSVKDGQIEVDLAEVPNEDELKARIGSRIVEVSDDEYNKTLFEDWNFSGSNVYRAGEQVANETENTEREASAVGGTQADGGNSADSAVQSEKIDDDGRSPNPEGGAQGHDAEATGSGATEATEPASGSGDDHQSGDGTVDEKSDTAAA